jgi:ubiquinol-cytochrome c reductase cytochrome c1 subunit
MIVMNSRVFVRSARTVQQIKQATYSTQTNNAKSNMFGTKLKLALGALGVGGVSLIYALESRVHAYEVELHADTLPFSHFGINNGLDMGSVRRGYSVYKQVCAACHSAQWIAYRHFANTFMTVEEAKAEAAEALIDDLNDKGEPIKRPGLLTDRLPNPYKNDKAAMFANNGALPPDLSVITLARHGGESYIFSLLTSYMDPPAGITVEAGKAYNPYFAGGVISMPQQLFDEGIEYADGTPATISQQAKDVCTFLAWCSEPYLDERKKLALKIITTVVPLTVVLMYYKRHTWSFIKTQKFAWRTVKGREPPPDATTKMH